MDFEVFQKFRLHREATVVANGTVGVVEAGVGVFVEINNGIVNTHCAILINRAV